MFLTHLLIDFCRRDNREQELKSHIHHVVAFQCAVNEAFFDSIRKSAMQIQIATFKSLNSVADVIVVFDDIIISHFGSLLIRPLAISSAPHTLLYAYYQTDPQYT